MKARPILFSGAMIRALLSDSKTQTRRIVKPQPHHGPVGTMVHLGDGGWAMDDGDLSGHWQCPYGVPSDLLWVKERHAFPANWIKYGPLFYDADQRFFMNEEFSFSRKRPSIHMPRWASRLTLEIIDVRVEHLQMISEDDAKAEGTVYGPSGRHGDHDPRWILGRCRDCRHWDTNLLPNGSKRPSCAYHYSDAADPQPSYGDAGQGCSTSFAIADGADETAAFQFRHFWDRINGASPDGHWGANPWVWAVSFKVHRQNVDDFLGALS